MSTSFNGTEETVREEIVDGALLLTICRPHAGNSIDTPTAVQLDRALRRHRGSRALRAVIVTGEGGKFFCTGGDLKAYRNLKTKAPTCIGVRPRPQAAQIVRNLPATGHCGHRRLCVGWRAGACTGLRSSLSLLRSKARLSAITARADPWLEWRATAGRDRRTERRAPTALHRRVHRRGGCVASWTDRRFFRWENGGAAGARVCSTSKRCRAALTRRYQICCPGCNAATESGVGKLGGKGVRTAVVHQGSPRSRGRFRGEANSKI